MITHYKLFDKFFVNKYNNLVNNCLKGEGTAMTIHGLEKLSLVDFDGFVAATVFTGGCNFRCPFCHNASLVTDTASLAVIDEKEIFDYLNKRRGVIEGVCVTGGEPTLNPDLPVFCEKLKKLGLAVKVDSNGTNPDMLRTLAENGVVDRFAIDIKNDKKNYARSIGYDAFDTRKIEKTVDFLLSGNTDYEFRTTIINEFHSENNLIEIGKWLCGAKKYFLQKFKNGENCLAAQNLTEVPQSKAEVLLNAVKPFVKAAKLRGYDLSG